MLKGNGYLYFPVAFSNCVMSIVDSIYYTGNSAGWCWHLISSSYPVTLTSCHLDAADNDWHYWIVVGY